jgi:hypothetical protein
MNLRIMILIVIVLRAFSIECPVGFIPIPFDTFSGTYTDFCVSKYEMKIHGLEDGNIDYDSSLVAESRPAGTPWRNLTQLQAKAECMALGTGYDLISNAEWMTIARSIERNRANWNDNTTHPYGLTNAVLNIGHTCRKGIMGRDCRMDEYAWSGEALPSSFDDTEGLFGYILGEWGEESLPVLNVNGWNLYRRTHYLDNGEIIWDFSGNVWEWIDWYLPLASDRARIDGVIDNEYLEVNRAEPISSMMIEKDYKSVNHSMRDSINANCLGRYHPTAVDWIAGVAMRGGNFMHGRYNNGIYALGMGYGPDPDHIDCRVGFRCVYRPEIPGMIEEEPDSETGYVIFPNPFNSACFLNIPSASEIIITGLDGRFIKKLDNRTIWTPDNTLSSGVFLVKAILPDNKTISKKIIYSK